MSQIADWIIPSHYRELKLSDKQRAAAHRLAEARKQMRSEMTHQARTTSPQIVVAKGAHGQLLSGRDFRLRPIVVRPTVSEPGK